ncbi:hypothetical protein K435DRAFT_879620 [Dendrothele bispora CBS 962.96]|uniref:Uncharacterized protein n=1 Tax=Dendrothele bispora (strain CBS 962.96) TaxID=1314807 RepID=A0A4S8KKS8_DENBC|nr:hypothetical protein K435DRAFT_879620 [Dendrothele bispora CBS 962.96]
MMLQQERTRSMCPEMKAAEWLYLRIAHGYNGSMEVYLPVDLPIDIARCISCATFDAFGLACLNYNFNAPENETEDVYLDFCRLFDLVDKKSVLRIIFPSIDKIWVARHASSYAQNNHVTVSLFPSDQHHLPIPRVTTRSRSGGIAARGGVHGALGRASCGRGSFTSAQIPTPPTSDGLIIKTRNDASSVIGKVRTLDPAWY